MKGFVKIIKKYVGPYVGYLGGSVLMNIFSALFNVFSFSLLIPILKILFDTSGTVYQFIPWNQIQGFGDLTNNIYHFVGGYISQYGQSRVLFGLCCCFCVITLIKTACYFGAASVMVPIRTGIVKDMRMELYRKIVSLPIGFFSQERKGDIIARMSGDVSEVEFSITSTLDMLIKNPILILIYLSVLFAMSWQLTVFTIVFAPLMILIMGKIGHKLKAQSLEAQKFWSDTMSQVEETIGGLRVIKAFLAEGKMEERFEKVTESMRAQNMKVGVRQASAHPVSEFLGSCMIAIVLWFGGTLILGDNSSIDAPAFISYMTILYSIIQPVKDLSKAAYSIPKGLASMERIDRILLAENRISEKESTEALDSFEKEIKYTGVSFRYDAGGREVLQNIDITLRKGRTIALVGQSGSGKSTLVDLLPRYYDVGEGSISIDGKDIRDLRIKDLRSLIGNVNQEAILFNDTIFHNIAFGVENATRKQVEAAARIANAHEFIMEKEHGYDEMIGDRGCKLSGGQRQRISIARAILKNPPILILDEATSALDTESEKLVQEALDRLTSERTTIAIAHRLSTIRNADEICVMHEGRIVERGRHEELLALGGYYKKLNDMQAL